MPARSRLTTIRIGAPAMVEENIRIPVVYGDLYKQLSDGADWQEQLRELELAYDVERIASASVQPGLSADLNVYTIGGGTSGRSLAIEIAPLSPTGPERVAARALIRALGSGSTDRQRLLHACLVRIYVIEFPQARRSRGRTPAGGDFLGAALARSGALGVRGFWASLTSHLESNRPDVLLSLRDAGGARGLGGNEGFLTIMASLPPEVLAELERQLAAAYKRDWPGSAAARGYKRARSRLSRLREHEIARFMSAHLRFGGLRRRFRPVPDKLVEDELAVAYTRNLAELRAAFGAGLIPAEPGVYLDLGGTGSAVSSAAFARWRLGADGLSAYGTMDDPSRRANFLLAAASAVIAGAASGSLDRP